MAARKAMGVTKTMRKPPQPKVVHPPFMKTNIKSGQAMPAPPLGPMLGQRNIPIGAFCKDFNEKTAHIKEGIPLPTRIHINPDRTYKLVIFNPPATYFLLKAAGIKKGRYPGQKVAGKVTLKHIYEIAQIKSQDPCWETIPLQKVCESILLSAHSCGIQVVPTLDPEEYKEFLLEQKEAVATHEAELVEKRQAKLLRL